VPDEEVLQERPDRPVVRSGDTVRRLAAAGHQRQRAAIEAGELGVAERWIRWCELHRSLLER